jgi:hypothetical protein
VDVLKQTWLALLFHCFFAFEARPALNNFPFREVEKFQIELVLIVENWSARYELVAVVHHPMATASAPIRSPARLRQIQ